MIRQLLESFKNDIRNNPKFIWIFGGVMVGVLVIAIGGIVIACWTPDAPDPKTASVEQIEDYLGSKYYMQKPMAERKEYTAALLDRMESQGNQEEAGEIMKRLWAKNCNAATSIQITAMSQKMAPLNSLSPKEKAQRINMFLTMAEMKEGRQKMQENYNKMFNRQGSEAEKRGRMIKEAVKSLPTVMTSTTPAERRRMIQTFVIAKKQMDRRYGPSSTGTQQPQPSADK